MKIDRIKNNKKGSMISWGDFMLFAIIIAVLLLYTTHATFIKGQSAKNTIIPIIEEADDQYYLNTFLKTPYKGTDVYNTLTELYIEKGCAFCDEALTKKTRGYFEQYMHTQKKTWMIEIVDIKNTQESILEKIEGTDSNFCFINKEVVASIELPFIHDIEETQSAGLRIKLYSCQEELIG